MILTIAAGKNGAWEITFLFGKVSAYFQGLCMVVLGRGNPPGYLACYKGTLVVLLR